MLHPVPVIVPVRLSALVSGSGGFIDKHVGDLHPDHRALAQMRRHPVGVVREGEAAAQRPQIDARQSKAEFGCDRFGVDRREFREDRLLSDGRLSQCGPCLIQQGGKFNAEIDTAVTILRS